MRKSGVRFPKAAQVSRQISAICSRLVERDAVPQRLAHISGHGFGVRCGARTTGLYEPAPVFFLVTSMGSHVLEPAEVKRSSAMSDRHEPRSSAYPGDRTDPNGAECLWGT